MFRKYLMVPRSYLSLAYLIVFALTIVSCGNNNSNKGGNVVRITLSDYSMEVDSEGVEPGQVLFVVKNEGNMEHGFVIDGLNTKLRLEDNLKPGETRGIRVELQPSIYTLSSPMDNHKIKDGVNVFKIEKPNGVTTVSLLQQNQNTNKE